MRDAFDQWRAELLHVGKIVPHEEIDVSVPQPEAEARCMRYVEMVRGLTGNEPYEYALAVLESVQVAEDYEVYECTFGALERFPRETQAEALLHELPRLIRTLPDRAGAFLVSLSGAPPDEIEGFNALLDTVSAEDQRLIRDFIRSEENGGWLTESVGVLGRRV